MYKIGLFLFAILPAVSLAQGRPQPLVFGINEGVTYRIAASEVRERYREIADDLTKLLKRPVRIVGGFIRGNTAVLLVSGDSVAGSLAGEALLMKEKDAWHVDDELMDLAVR